MTKYHTDSKNKKNGFCVIRASGNYDPRIGGHFVMVEPKASLERIAVPMLT